METDQCIFCKIVAGEMPSERVGETERSIAFRDISPHAPVHVLVVPKRHEPNLAALAAASTEDLADVFSLVAEVARAEGVEQAHRLIVNTGREAGQTVFHAHVHVLGGTRFEERSAT
jgi:histidine triad (HIT) family protein